jgi:hypothetical protein
LSSLSISNDDHERAVPLLGRYSENRVEQWIFPSLQFTCSGRVTKWRFRASLTSAQIPSPQCRINIGTWRLNTTNSTTIYTRHTSTAGRLPYITNNDPLGILTYELASPVQVEPGDIVGIEQQADSVFPPCDFYGGGFGNILSLINDLGSTDTISQSYRHSVVQSNFRATYLVPFIQPVIGKIINKCIIIGFPLTIGLGWRVEDRHSY